MSKKTDLSSAKVALIIASEGYQPIEYGTTKDVLEEAGVQVVTISNKPGAAIATDNSTTPVDVTIESCDVDDYDGILLIGGSGAMDHLDNGTVYGIIAHAKKHDKVFGAICISTRILAKSREIEGKKATGWNGDNALPSIYTGYNVEFIDKDAVINGLLVTANGPAAAEKFGKAIIRALNKKLLSHVETSDEESVYYEINE